MLHCWNSIKMGNTFRYGTFHDQDELLDVVFLLFAVVSTEEAVIVVHAHIYYTCSKCISLKIFQWKSFYYYLLRKLINRKNMYMHCINNFREMLQHTVKINYFHILYERQKLLIGDSFKAEFIANTCNFLLSLLLLFLTTFPRFYQFKVENS